MMTIRLMLACACGGFFSASAFLIHVATGAEWARFMLQASLIVFLVLLASLLVLAGFSFTMPKKD